MSIPFPTDPLTIIAFAGAFLYGTAVTWVLRSVARDLREDRQSDYQAL